MIDMARGRDVLARHSQQFLEASELLSECVLEHDDQSIVLSSSSRKSKADKRAKAKHQAIQDRALSMCCLTLAIALWSSAWPQAMGRIFSARILFRTLLR